MYIFGFWFLTFKDIRKNLVILFFGGKVMRWAEINELNNKNDRSKKKRNKKKLIVSALALKNLWIMIDLNGYMLSDQCLKFIMAIGVIIYS